MNGTVVITGANGSLALGFVESFLQLYPHHTLIATVRNPSVSHDPNTAKLKEMVARYPGAHVSIETLDLGKLSSVRSFADSISRRVSSAELPRISAVICNAATLSLEAGQKFTPDGYEATFQVCHVSHFLLILKLVGSLDTTSGRIVMLGSVTHYLEKPNPLSSLKPEIPANWEHLVKPGADPQGLVHDRGFQRYGTAKLANVILANDLNRRFQADPKLSKITALAMDPGGLPSSRAQAEQKKSTRRLFAVMDFLMPVLKHLTTAFRTTEDAGRDLVAVSLDPKFQGKGGYYVCQKQAPPAVISTDVEVQRGLWNSCCEWAGLSNEETML